MNSRIAMLMNHNGFTYLARFKYALPIVRQCTSLRESRLQHRVLQAALLFSRHPLGRQLPE